MRLSVPQVTEVVGKAGEDDRKRAVCAVAVAALAKNAQAALKDFITKLLPTVFLGPLTLHTHYYKHTSIPLSFHTSCSASFTIPNHFSFFLSL